MNKKITALIALKGNSKGIPGKNVKILNGKPLCYWVLSAAAGSKYITEIYVSTEDNNIKELVESFNFNIKVIKETLPPENKVNRLEEIMENAIKNMENFDLIITLQATSPLTTSKDIDNAIEKFITGDYDSMMTGVVTKRFFWTRDCKPLNFDYKERPLRQHFDGSILENGAFWITTKEIWSKKKNRLGGKIGVYEMEPDTAVELDEPKDWDDIETIIAKSNGKK